MIHLSCFIWYFCIIEVRVCQVIDEKKGNIYLKKKNLKKRTLHGFMNIAKIEGVADNLSATLSVTGDMKAG